MEDWPRDWKAVVYIPDLRKCEEITGNYCTKALIEAVLLNILYRKIELYMTRTNE